MRKRLITSLFILSLTFLSITSCNTPDPGPDDETCDPDFEDCGNETKEEIKLQEYDESNYTFDLSSTNENGSVSYEIFVRSFYDSDGDGIGDLNGVTSKLDYLNDLGVKTLWLMPIMPSPSYHGYDVNDYYAINPDYGTLDDFKNLVSKASEYNIDIMIDIVFNHSSNENPWFIESYNDFKNNNHEEGSKIDWYNRSETKLGSHYNRYLEDNSAWYESRFSYTMPDFNTQNLEVRAEMLKVLDYWIDLGCKGFRFDAVKYFEYEDTVYNAEFLSYLKDNVKDPDIYFVGECWDNNNVINSYYTSTFDSFFKFNSSVEAAGNDSIVHQIDGMRKASVFASEIEAQEKLLKNNNPNGYSSYFLSNHDMDRKSGGWIESKAKLAASLYLLLPGRPYIYYGEEIQLKGTRNTSPDDQTDAMRRLPIIWSKTNKEGECSFPEKGKENIMPSNYQISAGVEDALNTNYSLLNHYKKVINIRNKYPFIINSIFTNECSKLTSEDEIDNVLAYTLSYEDESITVIHNFERLNVSIDISKLDNKEILDEVSVSKLKPELSNNILKIGKQSTVILG